MPFSSLGLTEPLLRVINEIGYTGPTPIQSKAIPAVLSGHDVLAVAQTGTGKTASFVLPLLQRLTYRPHARSNQVRALVLTPTRELAIQVAESVASYGKYLSLKSNVAYGGVKINPQMMRLRGGTDVLVATPGRLLDLFNLNAVKFHQTEVLVLDEADRMLDMGFFDDIQKILSLLPKKRQNLLFSATFSREISNLTTGFLSKPVKIEITPEKPISKRVRQRVYEVDKEKKPAILSHLIQTNGWEQVLVFIRSKDSADSLVKKLTRDGVSAAAIHGNKSQGTRARVLDGFKTNKVKTLVATDVAARGLDIGGLTRVVNFDLPKIAENYIHRIGRTGRADSEGEGISLVSADEVKLLAKIEILIGQTLARETLTDFIPEHKVPLTRKITLDTKKSKKTKLKKSRRTGSTDVI